MGVEPLTPAASAASGRKGLTSAIIRVMSNPRFPASTKIPPDDHEAEPDHGGKPGGHGDRSTSDEDRADSEEHERDREFPEKLDEPVGIFRAE